MKSTLIGIMDSNVGGINRFIVDYIQANSDEQHFSILINGNIEQFYLKELGKNLTFYQICSVSRPQKLYHEILTILEKEKPDCLYLNVSTNLFFPVLQAANKCRVEEIRIHAHSSGSAEKKFIKRQLIIILNKLLRVKTIKLSTELLACSDKAATWLFGKNSSFTFVNNKVNESKFLFNKEKREYIRSNLNIEDKFCIGYIGSFSYQKNIFYFIKLASKLIKETKKFVIVMVGQGEYYESFKNIIKKKRLEANFILLGNQFEANDFYNAFDCFILPSRFEGLPIVGIEAQVNGLFCFFSNRISIQTQIIRETYFFNIREYKIVTELKKMHLRNQNSKTPLANYRNFITF